MFHSSNVGHASSGGELIVIYLFGVTFYMYIVCDSIYNVFAHRLVCMFYSVLNCFSVKYFGGKLYLGSSVSAHWAPPVPVRLCFLEIMPVWLLQGKETCSHVRFQEVFWGWQGGVVHMPFWCLDSMSAVPGFLGNPNRPAPSQEQFSGGRERPFIVPQPSFELCC